MTSTSKPATDSTRVVVGVDGSEPSHRALEWGAFLARTMGARLEAVIAWQLPASYGPSTADWDPEADMAVVLRDSVETVFGADRPVPLDTSVREGGAAHVLLEAAEGADLLVVGSRGHGGFAGLLLGSVSASVAEHAPCPVLVVHGDQGPPPRVA
ncbi:MAG TPA: universal stress protein [Jatrophihabitantaceae bacterium]